MNGRKAREIRRRAWQVLLAHGVRGGDALPRNLRRLTRSMKRDYRRTGRLPQVVAVPGVPETAFRRAGR